MHRFFIDPHSIHKDQFKSTDKDLCHQISKVLKMRVGKKIILCDNTENEYEAEWILVSKSDCEAKILSKASKADISSEKPVHLYVPPLKNQNRWELILEKGTEIGVASFTPLITERTEVTELRKPERLHRIIKEAAEQSGRSKLPEINPPIPFAQILSTIDNRLSSINLIASLHEGSQTIQSVLSKTLPNGPNVPNAPNVPIGIYIGPVGDFTEEEIKKALDSGFHPITLGSQVLRTETAALISCALVLQHPPFTTNPDPNIRPNLVGTPLR